MTSSIRDNLQNFQPCGAWTMISQIFMIPQLSADFKGISQKNSGSPEDPPPGKSCEKMEQLFSIAQEQDNFGNGRYVRNVIEKAQMAQAVRLLDQDYDRISDRDIVTLQAKDIELPEIKREKKQTIGFVYPGKQKLVNEVRLL